MTREKMYNLAIVDIETTGGQSPKHKIIEVAVILTDDTVETKRFETLIDPQLVIPHQITRLTGITNDAVCGKPTFREIAHELYTLLSDRVFVAHNVNFDYKFIQNEFMQAGIEFEACKLCTRNLSRHLYPEHDRHNLDSIMQRFQLKCLSRHRAMGDADVLSQLFLKLYDHHGGTHVNSSIQAVLKKS